MKKSNTAFLEFVAILIIGASIFFCWKTLLPKYQKAKASIALAENDAASAKAKIDSLNKAKDDMSQLGTLTDELFLAVPSDKDAPNTLTELEKIFVNLKIALPTIQISDSASGAAATQTASSNSNSVSISFAVSGSFEQMNVLIGTLEKDIRFMNIKSIAISKADSGTLSMAMQIEAYKRGVAQSATSSVPTSAAGE